MKKLILLLAISGALAACEDPMGTQQTGDMSETSTTTTMADDTVGQDRDQDQDQSQMGNQGGS